MPANSSGGIQIASTTAPGRSTRLGSRLNFRGWRVDVDPTRGVVSLPSQAIPTGGSVDDLAVCIDAAKTMARGRANTAPAATPDPPPPAEALAAVLRSARDLARERWHPVNFDIYECTSAAWTATGMKVPHTALVKALRRALPRDVRLIDFNDTSSRAQINALYEAAIALLLPRSASARGAA